MICANIHIFTIAIPHTNHPGKDTEVKVNGEDYICLTDMLRAKGESI